MKMDAVHSPACYPREVNSRQRAINNHPGTRENHVRCFGNFGANGTETPMATGQPEEVIFTPKPAGQLVGVDIDPVPERPARQLVGVDICTVHERLFMDFLDSRHRYNSFNASFSGNYNQMMESTISNNHGSEHDIFRT